MTGRGMRDRVAVPFLVYHGRDGGRSGWGESRGSVRNIEEEAQAERKKG